MTDEKGHLSLKDVPPGDYLAFAWEKVEDGDWFDPVVFKKVENDAVHVTVKGRGIEKIELKALKQ